MDIEDNFEVAEKLQILVAAVYEAIKACKKQPVPLPVLCDTCKQSIMKDTQRVMHRRDNIRRRTRRKQGIHTDLPDDSASTKKHVAIIQDMQRDGLKKACERILDEVFGYYTAREELNVYKYFFRKRRNSILDLIKYMQVVLVF